MKGEKNIHRSDKEYRKIPMLSASDLRSFDYDRFKFYKDKILDNIPEEEEYNKSIIIGSLVHCFLLEPQNFDKKFFMSICSSPPTANLLLFTESLYKHTIANTTEDGVVTESMDVLTDLAYADSGYKIKKEAVLKKFIEPNQKGETAKMYYEQLREANSKGLKVVCVDDINIAEKIVKQVLDSEFVSYIFSDSYNTQSFNELQIEDFDVFGVKMKAMLDRIVVDHSNKTISIYDIKCVFDVLNFKKEYWLKKRAFLQGYIYWKAIISGKADLGFNYDDYEVLPPIFIVVHSGCFYEPLLYKMSIKDLNNAENGFSDKDTIYKGVKEIIEDIVWAQEYDNWGISKSDYQNKGIRSF